MRGDRPPFQVGRSLEDELRAAKAENHPELGQLRIRDDAFSKGIKAYTTSQYVPDMYLNPSNTWGGFKVAATTAGAQSYNLASLTGTATNQS